MRLFITHKPLFASLFLQLIFCIPVLAHEIEIAGDVAVSLHIEPNDQPRARTPAKAWFAMTRKGGQIIPLTKCNCQLAIYSVPHQEGKTPPLMKPILKPFNVDQYQGIPGAIITFPKPGLYELELTGTAKPGANYKSFQLSYEVTVRK